MIVLDTHALIFHQCALLTKDDKIKDAGLVKTVW